MKCLKSFMKVANFKKKFKKLKKVFKKSLKKVFKKVETVFKKSFKKFLKKF